MFEKYKIVVDFATRRVELKDRTGKTGKFIPSSLTLSISSQR